MTDELVIALIAPFLTGMVLSSALRFFLRLAGS